MNVTPCVHALITMPNLLVLGFDLTQRERQNTSCILRAALLSDVIAQPLLLHYCHFNWIDTNRFAQICLFEIKRGSPYF